MSTPSEGRWRWSLGVQTGGAAGGARGAGFRASVAEPRNGRAQRWQPHPLETSKKIYYYIYMYIICIINICMFLK